MRLRNVKGSREMIATNDFVVHEEETMKGKWHDFFENENPIHIEVGMGKGRFIIKQILEENKKGKIPVIINFYK